MPATFHPTEPSTPWQWVLFLLAVLGEVLSIFFVLRVLTQGGSPASTLLWILVILTFPYLGLCLYYLFPRRLQAKRLRRRQNRLAWIEPGLDRVRRHASSAESFASATRHPVERLLCRIDPDGIHERNAVSWLPKGRDFIEAALSAIRSARLFVHCEVYILRADESGRKLLSALEDAARRGVEVRLLYDYFGSFRLSAADLAGLLRAGGRAAAFLPLLWHRRPLTLNLRNHRKLFVVDGSVAFVGGRNIGDEYILDRHGSAVWHDAMVAVEGPVVSRLHRVFVEDWYYAVEEDLAKERYFPEVALAGETSVGVLLSGPDRELQGMWHVLFQMVSSAVESIEISSPYLVPPRPLAFALQVAAGRGVRVRLYTNGPSVESLVLHRAQRSYYAELLRAGVEIHETVTDYNHAKLIVVDGRQVAVGSGNFDMRSAHLNYEIGVVVPDETFAQAVLSTLAERRATCRQVRTEDLAGGSTARLLEGACRLLSPLL